VRLASDHLPAIKPEQGAGARIDIGDHTARVEHIHPLAQRTGDQVQTLALRSVPCSHAKTVLNAQPQQQHGRHREAQVDPEGPVHAGQFRLLGLRQQKPDELAGRIHHRQQGDHIVHAIVMQPQRTRFPLFHHRLESGRLTDVLRNTIVGFAARGGRQHEAIRSRPALKVLRESIGHRRLPDCPVEHKLVGPVRCQHGQGFNQHIEGQTEVHAAQMGAGLVHDRKNVSIRGHQTSDLETVDGDQLLIGQANGGTRRDQAVAVTLRLMQPQQAGAVRQMKVNQPDAARRQTLESRRQSLQQRRANARTRGRILRLAEQGQGIGLPDQLLVVGQNAVLLLNLDRLPADLLGE